MRDSLVTLAGALLSIIVLVAVLTPRSTPQAVSRPNTEDSGEHGLKALDTWLRHNGINTHSLRKPVTRIDRDALPATGNLLIMSLPFNRKPLDSEWRALHEWIGRGNTALVLASLYHAPHWNSHLGWIREDGIMTAINELTDDEFALQRDAIEERESEFSLAEMQASIEAFRPAPYRLYPAVQHPLFEEVYELESRHTPGLYSGNKATGETQASYWSIESEAARLALRLVHGESPEHTAIWLLPVGSGRVFLSGFPDLVSNSMLKQQDNARWIANLLSHSLAEHGYVIFDDYHFGLSDLYDPDALFADERLHRSLLFIGAFWLIYALGRSPRLAPVRKRMAGPASGYFIEAIAGFLTRRINTRTVARELAGRLLDEISARTQLRGNDLWGWLHDHPRVARRDIELLQRASGQAPGRTKLVPLTRSIHRIQKVLS